MSYWNGKAGNGAQKVRKAVLRAEAEERQGLTPAHRRKAFRLGPVPEGGRTARSVKTYRDAFVAENGKVPEIVADDIENPNEI